MQPFENLRIWQKGMELVKEIYAITQMFPRAEMYGLVDQMRWAAVAIPSNIAEGCSRKSEKEFSQFLYIAYGSCAELRTQLQIASQLGFLQKEVFQKTETNVREIEKMTNVLLVRLRDVAENRKLRTEN